MTDTLTVEERSLTMSKIHSKDTKPELIVRHYLFSRGLRFRVNVKMLPGHPDVVLPKYKAIIEVRGCFWHRHPGCKVATTPKSHVKFWSEKFRRNVERDALHERQWAEMGWRLFVVWECELRQFVRDVTLAKLYAAITGGVLPEYETPQTEPGELIAAETPLKYEAVRERQKPPRPAAANCATRPRS